MTSETNRPGWPTNEHRTIVIGRTGSGKSVFGLWLLSTRNFHQMPWIIFDYKRDVLVRDIEARGAIVIERDRDGGYTAPIRPGLYIIRPDPRDPEAVDDFLHQCWQNTNVGLYLDEGYMVPQKRPYKSLDNILTQGRSMTIPVIMCYQRPVDMSQFATSQADFWAVFHVLKEKDREILDGYVGKSVAPSGEPLDVNTRLPKHYSLWYDVGEDRACVLSPSPAPAAILETFAARLQPPPEPEETPAPAQPKKAAFI